MALNKTYFETKGRDVSVPIPVQPEYIPPVPPTPPSPTPGNIPVVPRNVYSGNVDVDFYNNVSDPETLDKDITLVLQKTIVIKDECDILHFRVPFNDSSVINFNYAKIMDRYYYCRAVLDNAGVTWIHFDVDALMSWKESIKGLSGIIDRTGTNYNLYLNDPNLKITSYTYIDRFEATGGFDMVLRYYLLTVGGK